MTDNNIFEDTSFSNSWIVIDGGLYHQLYFGSDLDDKRGGDYPEFKVVVGKFFDALKTCNITPHVILDGPLRPEKKQNRQKAENQETRTRESSQTRIIPPLVKDVFIEVLVSRGIDFELCFGEADLTTALRANEKDCPVLSNDTDFCIYDLQKGYLPFKFFQWKNIVKENISAKLYKISKFCSKFKLRHHVMPVFAALAGNGYSSLEDIGQPQGLEDILKSLTSSDLNKLESWGQEDLEKTLKKSFGVENTKPFTKSIQTYRVEPDPPPLPPWMKEAVQRGRLTTFVISAMTEPFPEKDKDPSREIRWAFYGLLGNRPGGSDSGGSTSAENRDDLHLQHLNEVS